jgi:hypothetical protein
MGGRKEEGEEGGGMEGGMNGRKEEESKRTNLTQK